MISLEFIMLVATCIIVDYLWLTKGYYIMKRAVNFLYRDWE